MQAVGSTLLLRGSPLPENCFSLGHDVYLNLFNERISVRKYRSFGSLTLYPTQIGRIFGIDAWRQLMAAGPKVSSALSRGDSFAFTLDFHEIRVQGKGEPARRGVHFEQENRHPFALNSDQWERLVLYGRKVVLAHPSHPLPVTPPPPLLSSGGSKKRSTAGGGKGSRKTDGKRAKQTPQPEEIVLVEPPPIIVLPTAPPPDAEDDLTFDEASQSLVANEGNTWNHYDNQPE